VPFTSIIADVKFVAPLFVLFILCMSYFDVKHTPNDLDVAQTCSCINKDAFETRGHMPCWFTGIHNERNVVRVKIQLSVSLQRPSDRKPRQITITTPLRLFVL
jgi:hypothetical protein